MTRGSVKGLVTIVLAAVMLVGWPAVASGQEKVLPHLRFDGPVMETPPEFLALFGQDSPRVLRTIIKRIDKAREDEDVPALILTVDVAQMGRAQLEEICDALDRFRDSGKNIHCYLEAGGMGAYTLASTATEITIMPRGMLFLMGLYAEAMYFKGTLDKLGIEADVIQMGDYKSAGEMLTRTGPTEAAEENINWLLDGLYEERVRRMAQGRGLDVEQMKAAIDRGLLTAEQAHELKLVDHVAYRQEFLKGVKREYGGPDEVTIDNQYGLRELPSFDFSNPMAIFQFFGKLLQPSKEPRKSSIAVITLEGLILPGKSQENPLFGKLAGSRTIAKAFEQARKNNKVKAVVFRVDSPGGSGVASDVILEASRRCRKEKPLVVSMGNVAGSGGYWVSMGGKTIFADASTITGSIGVVSSKFVLKGLWDKLGFSTYEYSRGKRADMFNSNRRWTEEERQLMTAFSENFYKEFKDIVQAGRGDRLKDDLDKLAGGRVYTGAQAVENGLVDELGGLDEAIKEAARLAHISKYEVIQLPKPRSFFDMIMEDLGLGGDDEEARSDTSLRAMAVRQMLDSTTLTVLDRLAPEKVRAVGRMVLRVYLCQQEGAIAAMPYELIIR